MSTLPEIYRQNFKFVLVGVFIVLLLISARHQYLVDDAFISFRYSKNLIEGHGMVWNLGERVEGYSNFLWTILVAGGMKVGIGPELFTYILGVVCNFLGLILTFLLAQKLLQNRTYALLTTILVGTNYAVFGLATSGLETPLQMLLFVLAGYLFTAGMENNWKFKDSLLLAMILNIALLTRPDSVVLAGACIAGFYFTGKNRNPRRFIPLLIPFIVILVPYLVWKISFYGSIVPNSFNIKVHGFSGMGYGLFYLYLFLLLYFLVPYIALLGWKIKSLIKDQQAAGYLAVFSFIWMAYIVYVGGDFMDFRFMVPIIPFLMIVLVRMITSYVGDKRLQTALLVVLCLGTVHHMTTFSRVVAGFGVEKINELSAHLTTPTQNWIAVGKKLGELFEGTDVLVAVGPAGAIPYYSELPCIDLLGLTDPEIPNIAEDFSVVAGHRVITPLSYLFRRNVNLIVQPVTLTHTEERFRDWIRWANWNEIYRFYLDVDKPIDGRMINDAYMIGIPIEGNYILIVWYLTPHDEVDRVIKEHGLRKVRLTRR